MTKELKCPMCKGDGTLDSQQRLKGMTCWVCHGTGEENG